MDEASLQAGSGAWAKMQAKLRGARRVLAVLSPRYQESWWCVLRCAVVGLIEVVTIQSRPSCAVPRLLSEFKLACIPAAPLLCCDWALAVVVVHSAAGPRYFNEQSRLAGSSVSK